MNRNRQEYVFYTISEEKGPGQTTSHLVLYEIKCEKQQLVSPCVCSPAVFSSFTKISYWRQFWIFLFQIFPFVYLENTPMGEYKEDGWGSWYLEMGLLTVMPKQHSWRKTQILKKPNTWFPKREPFYLYVNRLQFSNLNPAQYNNTSYVENAETHLAVLQYIVKSFT